jgi:hypothetical protein
MIRFQAKVSALRDSERKVWEAATTGEPVDLRSGDSDLDSPKRWNEWGPERTVHAEVITSLLIGDGKAASITVRGLYLRGARITGELNLDATTLRCPLALLNCFFDNAIKLNEATAVSVRLSGSHVPAIHARQLRTRGDLQLDEGFSVSDGVELVGAHIGGLFGCKGGQFSNSNGPALNADRLTVEQEMECEGFSAKGEVLLSGAHIGGQLICRDGQFSNSNSEEPALNAYGITVDIDMFCDGKFSACGGVNLVGAHIKGQLICRDGQFSNSNSEEPALNAYGITIDQDMLCDGKFLATGVVLLQGAHIKGQLTCTGGRFSNSNGFALAAEGLTVDGSMFCNRGFEASDEGFKATGGVSLVGAHIKGMLICTDGQFSNSNSEEPALNAYGITVDIDMLCDGKFSAKGEVLLSGAHIKSQLICTDGQFSNEKGPALSAYGLTVDQDMLCDEGFSASGEVLLRGAHIGGQLICSRGQFSNSNSEEPALSADRLTVEGNMFCDKGFSAKGEVLLRGTHIKGVLICTDGQFSNSNGFALAAEGLTVDGSMFCNRGFEASDEGFKATGGVSLVGAHIKGMLICTDGQFSNSNSEEPALNAYGITVDIDMLCDGKFSAKGEVLLSGAHIKSQLICRDGQFSNEKGPALSADRLTVDQDMLCDGKFSAKGEVLLLGAHIKGQLDCTGGKFSSNSKDRSALNAGNLTVDGGMYCRKEFEATGGVSLVGANIKGQLDCTGGKFSNSKDRPALNAGNLTVDGGMYCRKEFEATGGVSLVGANIKGQLDCTGGKFSNSNGEALSADFLTVDGGMFCREGFEATGEVNLISANIMGQLDCTRGKFSKSEGSALNLKRVTVSGPLLMESAMLEGILDLTAAKTSSYHDNPAFWPKKIRIDRFVYDTIEGASAKERLKWLRRNVQGYSPQIYEQLAAAYHRAGHDKETRRILIEKQRQRFAMGNPISHWLSRIFFGWTVGYGYRTGLVLVWLAGLLVLGFFLFSHMYPGDLKPAKELKFQPPFDPWIYTLDLLLPVASLKLRDGWVAHGAALWWSVFFIIMGWILATAVVASLTGLIKRELK